MRHRWFGILLLGTFAFWASGTARYAHEQIEHHGRDASVQPDDDDDDTLAAVSQSQTRTSKDRPAPRPCVLCQMLTAMTADRSAPPQLPAVSARCVATVHVLDWAAPNLRCVRAATARGPPAAVESFLPQFPLAAPT